MLARTFKTAAELNIPQGVYDAFVKVLNMLETGVIPPELFNMSVVGNPNCGSAGCFIGWIATVDEEAYSRYQRLLSFGPLDKLCFPGHVKDAYQASREQAAYALRGYLTDGKDHWAEAMKY